MLGLIRHEIKLAFATGSGFINLLSFFVIAVTLFAFAMGPEKALLEKIAPGTVWVCALLTVMLSLPSVFARDYEDGTLEILFMQGHLPEKIVFAKIVSHWLLACFPLVLLSPVLGYMLQIPHNLLSNLVISLSIGTPSLSLIGALGAALTLGTRRAGALLGLLVLPLYIPILIFGVSAAAPIAGEGSASLLMLAGLLLFMLPVCVFACTMAVKAALEEI